MASCDARINQRTKLRITPVPSHRWWIVNTFLFLSSGGYNCTLLFAWRLPRVAWHFLRGTHEKIVMSAADHPKLVVSGACSYRLTKVYLFYVNSFMTFSEQNGYPILSLLMLIDQPENKIKAFSLIKVYLTPRWKLNGYSPLNWIIRGYKQKTSVFVISAPASGSHIDPSPAPCSPGLPDPSPLSPSIKTKT